MAQQGKQFLPGVLVVPVGTSVHFPNRDSVRHHVYSFSPAKKFELKLYTGTPANPVVFERAGVVTLGCNIHDRMVGWIVVVDTPYYAQAAEGAAQVQINGVPATTSCASGTPAWHRALPPMSNRWQCLPPAMCALRPSWWGWRLDVEDPRP